MLPPGINSCAELAALSSELDQLALAQDPNFLSHLDDNDDNDDTMMDGGIPAEWSSARWGSVEWCASDASNVLGDAEWEELCSTTTEWEPDNAF